MAVKRRAGQEGRDRSVDIPERSGDHAGDEHGHPAREVEHSKRGSAQIGRRGVRHQRCKQPLRQAHVQAPKHRAEQKNGHLMS